MKKGKKISIIIVLLILIIVAAVVLAFKILQDNPNLLNDITGAKEEKVQKTENVDEQGENVENKVEEKKIQIYSGTDRPIAVMIDNSKEAWPQGGLNKAYMVYEIIVEGGETRLMALFKGQNVEKIGPVRSSRHYFLDYAMENDAIYAHYGWSPKAETDISKYRINNINGIYESTETFWRVKDKAAPHNAVTSTEKLLECAKKKNYRTTSNKESVLKYSTDEINLEDGETANTVTIPHSTLQTVKYEYDEENKVYKRYARKKEQTDWTSGEAVTTKNIIITFCNNVSIAGDTSGRQDLKNIGTFDGYYITNGKAQKIKCIKNARDKQTVYQYLDGKEINVNDGNTFVNICPQNTKIAFDS